MSWGIFSTAVQRIFYQLAAFGAMYPVIERMTMHELSLARDMIMIISQTLGEVRPLDAVNITVGPLSGISPESLRFCFTEIARMEGFGEPELVITETEAKLVCIDCRCEYEAADFYQGCPSCGSIRRRILSGREFTVDSVEIEEGSD